MIPAIHQGRGQYRSTLTPAVQEEDEMGVHKRRPGSFRRVKKETNVRTSIGLPGLEQSLLSTN